MVVSPFALMQSLANYGCLLKFKDSVVHRHRITKCRYELSRQKQHFNCLQKSQSFNKSLLTPCEPKNCTMIHYLCASIIHVLGTEITVLWSSESPTFAFVDVSANSPSTFPREQRCRILLWANFGWSSIGLDLQYVFWMHSKGD
jgi:hypothetical protein